MKQFTVTNLLVQKIQTKENGDWSLPELVDLEPGLYLSECPDGFMYMFVVRQDGIRDGMFLPITEIGKIYAREAEQKVFEQINHVLEKGFGSIESKLKPISTATNNSDCILSEMDESLHVKLANIEEYLGDLRNLIAELPKHSVQQKSTLAEMSDAVVNIIKATK